MKIAVFGAAGRTGKLVVNDLLNRGCDVIAIDVNLSEPDNNKQIEWMDNSSESIKFALKNANAVISTIGHVKNSPKMTQSDTISQIIDSAKKHNNNIRLVSLTGTGVRLSNDRPSLIDRILNFAIKIIDPARVKDGDKHSELLINSNLEWTVLRVLKLTPSEKIQNFVLTEGGPAKLFISRGSVAKILCDLALSDTWLQKMPVVSS